MIKVTGYLLVGLALLGTYLLGAAGAYVQIGLMIIMTGAVLFVPGWRSELAGTVMFAGFAVLVTLFVIHDEWISAFNFILFLLAGPVIVAASAAAKPGNAILVARLAVVSILIALVSACIQVFILQVNPDHVSGIAVNRIQGTGVATILCFMALIGTAADQSRWAWLYYVVPVLCIPLLVLGDSRGPLLVFAALAVIACGMLSRHRLRDFSVVTGALVLFVGAILLFPAAFGRLGRLPEIVRTVINGTSADVSANIRFKLYKNGVRAFLDSPLIGHGWRGKAEATLPGITAAGRNTSNWHLHSDILDFAVSGGLIGLVVYVGILLAPIAAALRSQKDSQWKARVIGTTLLSVGLFSYGVFNAAFGFEYLTVLYVGMTAVLLGFCRDTPLIPQRAAKGQSA